jgi:hypothetical protein
MFSTSYSTNCIHCGKCVVGKVQTCFRCATYGPPAKTIFTPKTFFPGQTFSGSTVTGYFITSAGDVASVGWNSFGEVPRGVVPQKIILNNE